MVAQNKKSVSVLLTDAETEYKYLPDATNLVTCGMVIANDLSVSCSCVLVHDTISVDLSDEHCQ